MTKRLPDLCLLYQEGARAYDLEEVHQWMRAHDLYSRWMRWRPGSPDIGFLMENQRAVWVHVVDSFLEEVGYY